ncbi:hypothetical protein BSLA_02r2651 [Burkholderia stabilis]|nr:hypothetical protein BSLA_02r2651 [Burkholderia stabilis]
MTGGAPRSAHRSVSAAAAIDAPRAVARAVEAGAKQGAATR